MATDSWALAVDEQEAAAESMNMVGCHHWGCIIDKYVETSTFAHLTLGGGCFRGKLPQ
uniref:Uncharacterized protein n=1 Tax=Astyanax mexicanus TaxID=7994 RepID=A0A8B9RK67_ASTMX